MVRVQYRPSTHLFDAYYNQKGGSAFPIFKGRLTQKGHGLGGLVISLVRSIFPMLIKNSAKYAIPLVKKGAIELGKHSLKTGLKSISDVISKKKTPKKALDYQKKKLREKLAQVIANTADSKPKKRKSSSPIKLKGQKRKKQNKILNPDIFT